MKSLYDLEPDNDPKKQKSPKPASDVPVSAEPQPKKDMDDLKRKVKEIAAKEEQQAPANPDTVGKAPALRPSRGMGKALTIVNMMLLVLVLVLQVMIIRWQSGVNSALEELEKEVNNEKKLRAELAAELLKKVENVQEGATQAEQPAGSLVFMTTRKVNVRSSSSTRGKLVTKLKKGGVVKGISSQEGWRQIGFGNKKGWVSDKYLEPITSVTITATKMNIRSKPSARAKKVAVLRKGKSVPVLDYADRWYKIDLGGGKEGWVMRKYVKVGN